MSFPIRIALRESSQAFEADPDLAGVMGSYDNDPSHPGCVSQYRNLLHSYIHHSSQGVVESFWTGCGAIRREDFAAAGGFNEVYDRPSIEDVEFGVRLVASGRRIVLDPAIQVKHQKGWTLTSMVETDLIYRALPWTVLAWSGAGLPKNLNFYAATARLCRRDFWGSRRVDFRSRLSSLLLAVGRSCSWLSAF